MRSTEELVSRMSEKVDASFKLVQFRDTDQRLR